jgi:hypothetical protein
VTGVQTCALPIYSNKNETVEQETNPEEIYNFVKQLGRNDYNIIKDKLKEINSYGVDPKVKIKCEDEECGNEWEYIQQINVSDFFGKDS